MEERRAFRITLAICIVGIVVLVSLLWVHDTCSFQHLEYKQAYGCYSERVERITERYGIPAALAYVKDVIYPVNGYSMVHQIMHELGDRAFSSDQKLDALNMYLSPYKDLVRGVPPYTGFDGFVHGFLVDYMTSRKKPLPDQMEEICSTKNSIIGIPKNLIECYHMVGHVIMHEVGNKVDTALKYCDALQNESEKDACYTGTFMEDYFLYDPFFHQGAPRPDAEGPSMYNLCAHYTGTKLYYCDMYVGVSFSLSSNDLGGAFAECGKLSQNNTSCAAHIGTFVVASLSRSVSQAEDICNRYATPAYKESCISAASGSLKAGFGVPPPQSLSISLGNFLQVLSFSPAFF